ncbi:MAG: hypothetical protein QOC87_262, partial [Actinomycetota bacterium]|nr:hypothetical protein [Actinomycetota bacterium]
LAACSGAATDYSAVAGATRGGANEQVASGKVVAAPHAPFAPANADGAVSAQSGGSIGTAANIPEIGPRVIKNASLSVRVDRGHIQEAVHSVGTTAEGHRGYVVSTDFGGTDAKSGSVSLRVPASEFEATLSALQQLGHVTNQSVSGHDVSQEFIDLKARLRNASAQEQVLLRLMDRARTIEDTIRVQQQLEGVQLTIERLKGRIRYLDNETAFSTISVSLTEAGAAPARPASTIARAWTHAKDLSVNVVSSVVVAAGFVIPVALMIGIALLVYRALRPRFRLGSSS